jgi:hypothetical protein
MEEIATTGEDGNIVLFEPNSGTLTQTRSFAAEPTSIASSTYTSLHTLMIGNSINQLKLFDLKSSSIQPTLIFEQE